MKARRSLLVLGLLPVALVLGGCPIGNRVGADAETSVRGSTQAAALPPHMPQTTAGEGNPKINEDPTQMAKGEH